MSTSLKSAGTEGPLPRPEEPPLKPAGSPHVVIIGGGFGGLSVARALGRAAVKITLIDRRNFHLFQPLLYQVATGSLSPADIASPLRAVLKRNSHLRVLKAEVVDLDLPGRRVILSDGELAYDMLVIATGGSHQYFGRDEWATVAPGLKTLEDALEIRRRIFHAFEVAEREPDAERRRAWLRFVVVGGGPTGVELAGALGELAHHTLRREFRNFDPADTEILLLQSGDRILPTYPAKLSAEAATALGRLGVMVRTGVRVTGVQPGQVILRCADQEESVAAQTVIWAAGIKASPLGSIVAKQAGVEPDRSGRVIVAPDLSVPGYPEVFVVGDLAHFAHPEGEPLPGVAPVAMQQGQYVARLIRQRGSGTEIPPFRYRDRGNLAVIGRHAAVADFGRLRFSGFFAWLIWAIVHIWSLIEFDNRLLVFFQWLWSYLTRNRGARLITPD